MEFLQLTNRLRELSIPKSNKGFSRSQSVPNARFPSSNLEIPEIDINGNSSDDVFSNSTGSLKHTFKRMFSSPSRSPNRSPARSPTRSPTWSPPNSPGPISPISPISPTAFQNQLSPGSSGRWSPKSFFGTIRGHRSTSPSRGSISTTSLRTNRSRSPRSQSPNFRSTSLLIRAKEKLTKSRPVPPMYRKEEARRLNKLEENEDEFLNDYNSSFGHNLWYYGEITILCRKVTDESENIQEDISCNCYKDGCVIARIDEENNVSCSVIFSYDDEVYAQSIPYNDGYYSLDLSDPSQGKFSSLRLLVAHLVQFNYIERVTFSWLLRNGFSSHF